MRFSHVLTALCAFAAGVVSALVIAAATATSAVQLASLRERDQQELTAAREEIADLEADQVAWARRVEKLNGELASAQERAFERLAEDAARVSAVATSKGLPGLTSLSSYTRVLAQLPPAYREAIVERTPWGEEDSSVKWTIRWRDEIAVLDAECVGDTIVAIDLMVPFDLVLVDVEAAAAFATWAASPFANDLPPDWAARACRELAALETDSGFANEAASLGERVVARVSRRSGSIDLEILPSARQTAAPFLGER